MSRHAERRLEEKIKEFFSKLEENNLIDCVSCADYIKPCNESQIEECAARKTGDSSIFKRFKNIKTLSF
jgi:CO dehydrogenase/acetyl-CoA synthase epsilon subunit